jgi:DNA-binding response OmpR family regulator
VWGSQDATTGTREIVDVNVSQLRKRLARIGLRDAIKTYRGFGYGLRD